MKYPALDVSDADPDLLLAIVDEFAPAAAEGFPSGLTIFFPDPVRRDGARRAIATALPAATIGARDVDDDDWARRSQESLTPVTVGRIVVAPPWAVCSPAPGALVLVIAPSMGFGTGHHATTRLCLAALQTCRLDGCLVVDVGTGSGVLALAARMLGARRALGIDNDPDAVQAAHENLAANPLVDAVGFLVSDLRDAVLPAADILIANLTGALLIRSAGRLVAAVRPGGTLIVSGLLAGEREEVVSAIQPAADLVGEAEEEGWVALRFKPFGHPRGLISRVED